MRSSGQPMINSWINHAAGHWRTISPGVARSMTVTDGMSTAKVRAVTALDLSDSQADSPADVCQCSASDSVRYSSSSAEVCACRLCR